MLLGEPLDGAEKRGSKATGPPMLGVGPGHPRLGRPFPHVFQTAAVAPLAWFAAAARFLASTRAPK